VIVQASRGARSYAGDRFLYHLMLAAQEAYPDIPVALHQDHGNSPETCISAIELGFTSVMMDGSLGEDAKTPLDFEDNVAVTRQVVEYAHARGVTVEGELGTLGGIEAPRGPGKAARKAMKEMVAQRMQELGMAGHAGEYEPMSLEDMAARYASGVRMAV
jgi:fructose-bisphosphate aldolase, class II